MSERYKAQYEFITSHGTRVMLTSHFKFERATLEQKFNAELGGGKPICNGCGPSGYGWLVPDSILGVVVTICGHIHNWSYQFGIDREDKMVADETFGDNLDRLIRADYAHDLHMEELRYALAIRDAGWLGKKWENYVHQRKLGYLKEMFDTRITLAEQAYEKAVRVWGKSAFWDKRKIGFTLNDVG